VLFSLPRGVQFSKLNLELVDKHVKVIEKGLSLRGFLLCSIYKKVINYLYIRFILISSYSI